MSSRGVLEHAETELVPSTDPRAGIVSIDRERMGGVPCFAGTRVPIRYLFEYLSNGKTLDMFLDDFEGVPRHEAIAALEQGYERLMEGLPTSEDSLGSLRP